MKLLIIVLVISGVRAIDLEFIKILLTGNAIEIYNLTNPHQALLDSLGVLSKIRLTNFQQKVIWDVFKNNRRVQQLTADDLILAMELLPMIPEEDLSHLNMNGSNIVNILGKVTAFSHRQASVIANSIKIAWKVLTFNTAEHINRIGGLVCGLSEDELATITHDELKKIDSKVFQNLFACSDEQLRVLYSRVQGLYGKPQSWSEGQVQHIGMILLILDHDEIKSLRASALKGIDFKAIAQVRPELLNSFSKEQLSSLNAPSKMVIHQNTTSKTAPKKLDDICLLIGLLLKTYLLLRF